MKFNGIESSKYNKSFKSFQVAILSENLQDTIHKQDGTNPFMTDK